MVLLAVEARGMEPVECKTKNDFTVITNGGSIFEDVDIEDEFGQIMMQITIAQYHQDLEYSWTAC